MVVPKRARNFTEQEKREVLMIVGEYKHVFDNKSTDGCSRQMKNKAWAEVAQKFNNMFHDNRSPMQMQLCYKNLKQRIRMAKSENVIINI